MPEFPLPGAFEWVRHSWGQALRCRALAAVADHFFTTRDPAFSQGSFAPGDGWHQVALSMGVQARAIVCLRQVHGTNVVIIRHDDQFPPEAPDWSAADIAASDHPGVALSVRVADCMPILLADAKTGAAAAVHAGWRGTAAGAAEVAVQTLVSRFGADPGDIVAAIGPGIGPCCCRVGPDVRDAFAAVGRWGGSLDAWFSAEPPVAAIRGIPGPDPSASGGRPSLFLDAWASNADQLCRAGVPRAQVYISRACTSCHRDVFHSYRVDGERAGRMIGVIRAAGR